jgi:hypothetical protein
MADRVATAVPDGVQRSTLNRVVPAVTAVMVARLLLATPVTAVTAELAVAATSGSMRLREPTARRELLVARRVVAATVARRPRVGRAMAGTRVLPVPVETAAVGSPWG